MNPLLLGAALAVTLLCALALGSATGVIPDFASHQATPYEPLPLTTGSGSAVTQCPSCGTVLMIRTYEIRGDLLPLDTAGAGAPGSIVRGAAPAKAAPAAPAPVSEAVTAPEEVLKKRSVFRVTLRMEDGSVRTVSQRTEPEFRPGDKVRLLSGSVVTGN
jgi:outer membrane lipoprotein SlyB